MMLRQWAAVAVCMLAVSGVARAQSQGDEQKSNGQQHNAKTEQQKAGTAQTPIGGTPVESQVADHGAAETKIYQPDCRQPKNQPDADLCTQRRVADAAEKALQYTLAQTIIGGLGVLFVVVTLGFTARANKAAAIAAQAAVDAVGAERAWMSMWDNGFRYGSRIAEGSQEVAVYAFHLVIKNAGRSPAIRAMINRQALIIDRGADMPIFSFDSDENDRSTVIGPGLTANCNPFMVEGQEVVHLRSGAKDLAFCLKIEYETIEAPGVKRITEIGGKFYFIADSLNDNGQIVPQFGFSPQGTQNSAS